MVFKVNITHVFNGEFLVEPAIQYMDGIPYYVNDCILEVWNETK